MNYLSISMLTLALAAANANASDRPATATESKGKSLSAKTERAEGSVDKKQAQVGGKHWSDSKVGLTGFEKYETPGKTIRFWPAEDRVVKVVVADDGTGGALVKLKWQLQPNEKFPDRFPEYLTYIWGDPDGKAHGFGVTKKIDPKAKSGEVELAFNYSKNSLEQRKGEQDIVFLVLHNGQPLGNFLRLKLAFPQK